MKEKKGGLRSGPDLNSLSGNDACKSVCVVGNKNDCINTNSQTQKHSCLQIKLASLFVGLFFFFFLGCIELNWTHSFDIRYAVSDRCGRYDRNPCTSNITQGGNVFLNACELNYTVALFPSNCNQQGLM